MYTHSECRRTITLVSVTYNLHIQEILFLSSENDITNVLSKRLCDVIIRMRLVIVASCHRQTLSSALNLSWEPVVCEKVEQEWREEATFRCACVLPFENIIWSKIIIRILQPFIQRQCHHRNFLNRLWTSPTSRKESSVVRVQLLYLGAGLINMNICYQTNAKNVRYTINGWVIRN